MLPFNFLLFNYLIAACWAVFCIFWLVLAFQAKRNVNRNRGIYIRLAIAAVIVLVLQDHAVLQFIHLHPLVNHSLFLHILGVAVSAFGVALAIWARITIGRNWGMPMSIKAEPELVISGPYQYVRHPIYSGVMFAAIGSGLAISGWWLVGFVAFFIYFFYGAKKEEQYLMTEFPTQYPEYKKRTKMLIPFII